MTRLVLLALMAAAALRIVASLVSGFVTLAATNDFLPPDGSQRTGQVLSAFGSGGDTMQAIILVIALAVLWRWSAPARPVHRTWLSALAVVTAALVVCRVVGVVTITASFTGAPAAAQQAVAVGFGVADLVITGAVLGALRLLPSVRGADGSPAAEEPVLFAVDRKTGEVFAFFSAPAARRSISAYSVEDDEFAFYDDEGRAVGADVVDGQIRFRPSEEDHRDELMTRLRAFAAAKGLDIDDLDDPLAYVAPINDWQWLELWPGWLRGLGRLSRRARRI